LLWTFLVSGLHQGHRLCVLNHFAPVLLSFQGQGLFIVGGGEEGHRSTVKKKKVS
jgi:hypothetical protein